MEVDGVPPMGGLREKADPGWARAKVRRRRFTEDVREPESEEAEPAPDFDDKHEGGLDVTA